MQTADVEVEYISAPHEFDFSSFKREPNGVASRDPAEPSREEEVEALDRMDLMHEAAEAADADGEPMAGLGATPGLGAPGGPLPQHASGAHLAMVR